MNEEVRAGFFVCAAICGKDGVISSIEEQSMFQCFEREFDLNHSEIEQLFNDFFNSKEHIDKYLSKVESSSKRELIYKLSKECASSDGLEIHENIALLRTQAIWGLS